MARCTAHPDREAVAKCRRCGRPFCEADLEEAGEFKYCFECLKDISHEARAFWKGKFTLHLVACAIISALVGLAFFFSRLAQYVGLADAIKGGSLDAIKAFLTPAMLAVLGPTSFMVAIYYVLAVGLIESKRWAFGLALLLNIAVLAWRVLTFSAWGGEDLRVVAAMVVGPILIILIAASERRSLSA